MLFSLVSNMSSDNSKLHCWPTAVLCDNGVSRMYMFYILSGPFANLKMSLLHYDGFPLNIYFVIRSEPC